MQIITCALVPSVKTSCFAKTVATHQTSVNTIAEFAMTAGRIGYVQCVAIMFVHVISALNVVAAPELYVVKVLACLTSKYAGLPDVVARAFARTVTKWRNAKDVTRAFASAMRDLLNARSVISVTVAHASTSNGVAIATRHVTKIAFALHSGRRKRQKQFSYKNKSLVK